VDGGENSAGEGRGRTFWPRSTRQSSGASPNHRRIIAWKASTPRRSAAEIERKLFGDIDTPGAHAVRPFVREDVSEWHRHFTSFFEYLDIQKLRTPKRARG
jgi:hypothetical protein